MREKERLTRAASYTAETYGFVICMGKHVRLVPSPGIDEKQQVFALGLDLRR
jgi:hypothetical protein